MLTQDQLELQRKAGKITAQVLEFGKEVIKKGVYLLDAHQKIEQKIIDLGGKPAFPVQISCNEIAAHYCPEDDNTDVLDDQLCSLDVGVHVDGYIGDSALTIDLSGKYTELIKASQEALKAALEITKIGTPVWTIGKAIEDTIKSYGYNPVRNLSGHGLGRFCIHDKPTIPNYNNKDTFTLKKGMTIAIEPFATPGVGLIEEKGECTLFEMKGKKSMSVGFVRDIAKEIEALGGLPFTTRWLTKKHSYNQVQYALNQLNLLGTIHEYPPLVEKSRQVVSQAEHSVYIDDEIIILTK